jgi:hypothetical protein
LEVAVLHRWATNSSVSAGFEAAADIVRYDDSFNKTNTDDETLPAVSSCGDPKVSDYHNGDEIVIADEVVDEVAREPSFPSAANNNTSTAAQPIQIELDSQGEYNRNYIKMSIQEHSSYSVSRSSSQLK